MRERESRRFCPVTVVWWRIKRVVAKKSSKIEKIKKIIRIRIIIILLILIFVEES